MFGILSWLRGTAPVPNPVAGEYDVYPVHELDDSNLYRDFVVSTSMLFDDVLDVQLLHDSLWKLFGMGDWRKLGGRVHLRTDGRLEIHAPKEFTKSCPPFNFFHEVISSSIAEHPVAKNLPRPHDGENPTMFPGPTAFADIAFPPGICGTVTEMGRKGEPQYTLHVLSFPDATVVNLIWAHTATDASGLRELFNAWALVLEGRDDEVPPLRGAKEDVMKTVGINPVETYCLEGKKLGVWGGIRFGLEILWEKLTGRKVKTGVLFLPAKFVDKLNQNARGGFSKETSPEGVSFISEGDILSAWLSQLIARTTPNLQSIALWMPMDLRSRLNMPSALIQNILAPFILLFTREQATELPLGQLAAQVRHALNGQSAPAQIEASAYDLRTSLKKTGNPSLYGVPGTAPTFIFMSSWAKAKIWQTVDFSVAVVRAGAGSEEPGRMVCLQTQVKRASFLEKNAVASTGRDRQGNLWLFVGVLQETWDTFVKEMMKAGS